MNSYKIQLACIMLSAFGILICLLFILQSNNTLITEGSKGLLVILSVATFHLTNNKIVSKNKTGR